MSESLFDRIIIPVASEMDARRTCAAVLPRLRQTGGEAHVVHVIEHTEGYINHASTEQLEQDAEGIFNAAHETFEDVDFTAFETHLHYGTDVTETVYDACEEVDATAVVFVSRHTSRWKRLLTGDVALNLITNNPYPVIVLPDPELEPEPANEGDEQA